VKKISIRFFVALIIGMSVIMSVNAQNQDSVQIRKFFEEEFNRGKSYPYLDYLCHDIGHRLSGSKQAEKAVQWTYQTMKNEGFDSVWLQEVKVPRWERGKKETAFIFDGDRKMPVKICALGGSIATSQNGIKAKVIEVNGIEELKKLDPEKVKGNIIFYNKQFDKQAMSAGHAYGGTVEQRSRGAIEASRLGAIGIVLRSLTHSLDTFPHTGAMNYNDSITKIPACAISTVHAEMLSTILKRNPDAKFYFQQNCKKFDDAISYNVIGEIKGSEKPDEIIIVGGHLDSWDLGQGAHDDGTGSVQCMEVLRLFKTCGIRPKRTIRTVLFMNEENGLRGGLKYAELSALNNEKHIAAIETDAGGFMPRFFGVSVDGKILDKISTWQPLLEPYGIQKITNGGGGADIGPLKKQGTVLIGFHPDSQRYFDYHHTDADTFDKVNKRELQFGVVTIAGLLYLLSEYGL